MAHELKDATLVGRKDGIVATCTCGWESTPSVSSMIASLKFREHQTSEAAECYWCGAPPGVYCAEDNIVRQSGRCPRKHPERRYTDA